MLDDETAIQAIKIVGEPATRNNIEWALAGDLAVVEGNVSGIKTLV